MQDNAGRDAVIAGGGERVSLDTPCPSEDPRMVAAPATPMASRVMTVSAALATDFSARNNVISTMIAKNPAAARVSHIGKVGERQN